MTSLKLHIAPDALVLAIGCSGAGKSTALPHWFKPYEILSSDHFRTMLTNDAAEQTCSETAFALMAQIAAFRLKRGLLTVIDATNLDPVYRRPWFTLAATHARPCYGLVWTTPPDVCRRRNAQRSRRVPEPVLRDQFTQFRSDCAVLHHEPFHRLYFLAAETRGSRA